MDTRLGQVKWGPHGERKRTSPANWRQPKKWERRAIVDGVRARVFCASLADWLDNKVPQDWREDLGSIIDDTPGLDWLLLTKRIENFHDLNPWGGKLPKNVWIGITTEDQRSFYRRWEILKTIPAVVRFISYEPALGEIADIHDINQTATPDWIIMGGESGSGARPMHPDWARKMRDMCEELSIPFFFKQWGAWEADALLFSDVRTGACPPPSMMVGKLKAGKLLDGQVIHQFPIR